MSNIDTTIHGKFLAGEKFVNHELFTEFFLAMQYSQVHRKCIWHIN